MNTRLVNPTRLRQMAVGLLATLAGLDKFFDILTDWGGYVSPVATMRTREHIAVS